MANISQIKLPDNSTYNLADSVARESITSVSALLPHTATITNTPIASFSDGADNVPVSSLIVDIDAVQAGSGTPSPDNVRAISGWNECNLSRCGVNLWDEEYKTGYYSSSGTFISNSGQLCTKNKIAVKPNTTYYMGTSDNLTISTTAILFYKADETLIKREFIPKGTFTTDSDTHFINVNFGSLYGGTYNNDLCINYPATDTEYHAYDGETKTIDFGQTVYRGYLNVTTGVLGITCEMIKLSDIPKTKYGTYEAGARFITTFFDAISNTKLMGNSLLLNAIGKTLQTPYPTSGSWIHFSAGSSKTSFLIDQTDVGEGVQLNVSSVNSWFDSINAYAVYELTTPQVIQLTPAQVRTLLNDNNIFADTGDINELVYFKTGCESITELIDVMHDDSKMSYSNAYYKKTCNQLTDPGIYYNIDTTGSPAEGYSMTTLITTYNCQILVYLGLVVNTRLVKHHPISGISFSPWMRLANENDLDGVVIPYNAEYPSLGTIYDVIESIRSPLTQTVTLAANSWDSSTHLITVSVTGVTSTSVQDVIGLPATSSANISNNEALQDANIMDAGQSTGSLTFYAETVPTTDLQIRVIVRG